MKLVMEDTRNLGRVIKSDSRLDSQAVSDAAACSVEMMVPWTVDASTGRKD